ncbi:MAG: APC family permease [Anaerolineales bacterium]|nr:APC family permease [Anaerolineales bacterium]
MKSLRELIIGPPIASQQQGEERLTRLRALAALSPDALSSIAYANQEIFLGLAAAGAAGLAYSGPIAVAVVGLLVILSLSYAQTIVAYPSGGGSYTVARENLGANVGLVAAAALMIDYVLNVAVSVTAGVAAAASAFPALWEYRTPLALGLLLIVTLANLRGLRESGTMMTIPVYFFVGMYVLMIGVGLVRAALDGPGTFAVSAPPAVAPLTLLLVLHTFSAGCTALTGIESISNGVPIFKAPEAKHANQTMLAMTIIMAVLFVGTTGLTQYFAVVAGPEETILSALARRVWGSGALYLLAQFSTLLVLMVAANTSFVGFPRVASIVARDRYLPRQLTLLGDRLVFSNGIGLLAVLAGLLIVGFQGDTHALIPLFAVGAFLAFTLSQAGMVRHWWRQRGPRWQLKAALNGLGALATGVTLVIIGANKFREGAWIVVALVPLLVFAFWRVHAHYQAVRGELTLAGLPPSLRPYPPPRLVMPISSLHRGTLEALRYAESVSNNVTAVHIEIEAGSGAALRAEWAEWGLDQTVKLEVVPSPYRSVIQPFLEFLDRTDAEHNDGRAATVLLPEFVPARWWQAALHNQTAWVLKLALLYRRRAFYRTRPFIDLPYYLHEEPPDHPRRPAARRRP